MDLDSKAYSQIVNAVFGNEVGYRDNVSPLSADQARAIIGIVRLAAAADRRDDVDERTACETVVHELATRAGIDVPPELDEDDPGEPTAALERYAQPLFRSRAGDLAYALAYVVSVSDIDLAPEEFEFEDDLARLLDISEARCEQLTAVASALLTPALDL